MVALISLDAVLSASDLSLDVLREVTAAAVPSP
jgi:hypothetical protein